MVPNPADRSEIPAHEGQPDPMGEVRAAWQLMSPPDRSDSLAEADEVTRGTVELLRSAWQQMPVPTPKQIPANPIMPAQTRRHWTRRAGAGWAAAAALFVTATAISYVLSDASDSPTPPTDTPVMLAHGGGDLNELSEAGKAAKANRSEMRRVGGPNQGNPAAKRPRVMALPPGAAPHIKVMMAQQMLGTAMASGRTPGPQNLFAPTPGNSDDTVDDLLEKAMLSNQQAQWAAAVEFASQVLLRDDVTQAHRCVALTNIAHAQNCMGQRHAAALTHKRLQDELAASD